MTLRLPTVGSRVVDPGTGLMNRDWYLALLNLASTVTGANVSSVNIAGNNGITVVGSPITSAGVITLGIGNLTCASAVIAGSASVGGTLTAANVVATAAVQSVNISATGTVTSANIVATATVQTVNLNASATITSLNVITTGTILPSTTNGLMGTGSNDSANAGRFGEFAESEVLIGGAIPLTSLAVANIASLSLSGGDWDVFGNVAFTPGVGTTISVLAGWISTVSGTFPTIPNKGAVTLFNNNFVNGQADAFPVGFRRISLTTTTNVFLEVQSTFGVSTLAGYGYMAARRAR